MAFLVVKYFEARNMEIEILDDRYTLCVIVLKYDSIEVAYL
jgi:hypothetical protein